MKKNWSIVLISVLVSIVTVLIIYHTVEMVSEREVPDKESISQSSVVNVKKTETKNEVIYEVTDYKKDLAYSWTFNKDDGFNKSLKNDMEIDMNLRLDLLNSLENKELNSLITNDDSLIISFEHHGQLPTKAKVRINVNDKYKDGERLYLYYLNEDKTQVEYIDNEIPVKNGYVEFEITHCSKYFLTASIIQEAVNNPKNVNLIIIVMVVVIIVLIAATLLQNKK